MKRLVIVATLLALAGPSAAGQQPKAPPRPCASGGEYRSFDFWIGEWEVFVADRQVGTNRIERAVDGCLLVENWQGKGGVAGKSLNFYDAERKSWRQVWVDSTGSVLELEGGLRDGKMVLEGTANDADGTRVLHRITWSPLPDGTVRQHWQTSRDGAKTWSDAFDGLYKRAPTR
jgi:hypothetical protein